MAIPKWRLVRGTDDGCSIYQCLNCKKEWEGRGNPKRGWKFCPYCGCQWNGQHICREHCMPQWEYKLRWRQGVLHFDAHERKLIDRFNKLQRPQSDRCWIIENREVKFGKWYVCQYASEYHTTSLIDVVSTLQLVRKCNTDSEFKCVCEYRARIVKRSEVPHFWFDYTICGCRSDLTLLEAWRQ